MKGTLTRRQVTNRDTKQKSKTDTRTQQRRAEEMHKLMNETSTAVSLQKHSFKFRSKEWKFLTVKA